MKIGVSFDGFAPFPSALAFAREAVEAGASSLWMADHLGYREPMLTCLAFALATANVRVIPTAVSPFLRHPMPTAMQLATLAEAAPGRVAIALGVGNPLFLRESGEAIEQPLRVTREFVAALRGLWSGEAVAMDALRFRLDGARMMFNPPQPIPIYLAPIRQQMLKLAGKIGDGVVLSAGLSVGFVKESLAFARSGISESGRPPERFQTACYISFLAAPDRGAALATIKKQLAFLLRNRFLDENIASTGIRIDQEGIIAAMSARDFERAQSLIPDEAADAFAVAGTLRDCCDKLQKYSEAGVAEPVLLMAGTPEDQHYGLTAIRELAAR
jgi:alkanesulfonate monooxygenase SsuD/methylene tetrahydromethanopterin reductase-like flavin-dependent oxidoreductase (luciferase family)